MQPSTDKFQMPATYCSQDDLEQIHSPPVQVVVKYILDNLTERNVSYRARVRTPDRVQVIKIRSIQTSSEIAIVVPLHRNDLFQVRFIEHGDRYTTTTPSRIVIRKVDFDVRKGSDHKNLSDFIDKEIITWLVPNGKNVKPPPVPMLVLEDVDVCPSSLVAIGFVVEHATMTAGADGALTATVSNKHRKITRTDRTLPDVVLSNTHETLVGRVYVEFSNGDYLFMTDKIFRQQFQFFRAGMVDMSVRH